MQFFEFLSICQSIVNDFMSGAFGNSGMFNSLNSTIGESINNDLQIFYDVPLIGDVLQNTVGDLIDATLGDVSILYFAIGVGVPAMVVYSFVKWLVGIVTGS